MTALNEKATFGTIAGTRAFFNPGPDVPMSMFVWLHEAISKYTRWEPNEAISRRNPLDKRTEVFPGARTEVS